MQYYNCDHISWKHSLQLLKTDTNAQRVYSSLWQMTRDVLQLSLTISGAGSLALLIPFLLHPLDSWVETFCIIFLTPLLFILPLTWLMAYFGWYRNAQKIDNLLQAYCALAADKDSIWEFDILFYAFEYRHSPFFAMFKEKHQFGKVTVAKGSLVTGIVYWDKHRRDLNTLHDEIEQFTAGKTTLILYLYNQMLAADFGVNTVPSITVIKETLDMILYLAERFDLKIISPEDSENEEEQQE